MVSTAHAREASQHAQGILTQDLDALGKVIDLFVRVRQRGEAVADTEPSPQDAGEER